jgi:hypothetical protein
VSSPHGPSYGIDSPTEHDVRYILDKNSRKTEEQVVSRRSLMGMINLWNESKHVSRFKAWEASGLSFRNWLTVFLVSFLKDATESWSSLVLCSRTQHWHNTNRRERCTWHVISGVAWWHCGSSKSEFQLSCPFIPPTKTQDDEPIYTMTLNFRIIYSCNSLRMVRNRPRWKPSWLWIFQSSV